MHYKLPVSNYKSIKQLLYSCLIKSLSIDTYKVENICIVDKKIHLHKDRDENRVLYTSSVSLQLSKSQNRKPMELASAIASDLSRTCDDVFTIQIVPPGWIHFELTHSTLATWLQSLAVGSLGEEGEIGGREQGAGEAGGEELLIIAPCPMPNLFAVQHAHARCCSLVLLAHREGLIQLKQPVTDASQGFWDVISPNPLPWLNCDETLRLNHPDELHLISELIQVLDNIECPNISRSVKWEKVALNLSQAFENFWSNCRIWGEVKITLPELAQARLGLLMATQSVLRYVLEENLGVFAPLEL
ncbi:DALR anticodon-binding domain-containing protein [Nostoc sp. TCL240-02]|uniref:DALR anticodon-binding domain-containing protein n=1 Tax=Nostoc sp. TCL240-02 TaxID=2572090 RepID=UPI00157F91CA|nr:DALR anticodon-binding domain-containing protein [Nostoc sp. TCL240-02]QKQ72894.1 glutamate acetyltransferase [Nostoc sp. TCL240-02]